ILKKMPNHGRDQTLPPGRRGRRGDMALQPPPLKLLNDKYDFEPTERWLDAARYYYTCSGKAGGTWRSLYAKANSPSQIHAKGLIATHVLRRSHSEHRCVERQAAGSSP